MKALATLAACLVAAFPVGLSSPALAAHGFAPHMGPAPHLHHGPVGMGRGRGHHGEGVGIYAPDVVAAPADAYEQPAAAILPPPVILAPQAAYCPPPELPRLRHTGPRIIYIGHQPTVEGPTVIYGTD